MPKQPLQTSQEKLLYIASLMGIDNALQHLEEDVKSNYVSEDSNVVPLLKIK